MSGEDGEKRQDSLDWQAYRILSIQPHGFKDERITIWPKLLFVDDRELEFQHKYETTDTSSMWSEILEQPQSQEEVVDGSPHSDERQIELDTDRSFVLYPVDSVSNRDKLQSALNRLIVSVFRRRPHLHYFQGYHDIVSVIFLTLPTELRLPVVEKLSLHRLRDSMGTNLDPVVGLLRILQRLLRLIDPKYSDTLERTAPLPYYALSNLLTLFSHDVPTLPLIQHIFDYMLCRPPIVVVYLAAALILTRREEVQLLEDEGEEGMMHSLLTVMPNLYEEGEESSEQPEEKEQQAEQRELLSAKAGISPDVKPSSEAMPDTSTGLALPDTEPPSGKQDEKTHEEQTLPQLPNQAAVRPHATGNSVKTEEAEPMMPLGLPSVGSPEHDVPPDVDVRSASRSDDSYDDVREYSKSAIPKESAADPGEPGTDKPPSEFPRAPEPDISIKAEPPDDDAVPPPPPAVPSEKVKKEGEHDENEHEREQEEEKEKETTWTSSPDPLPRPHRPRISLSVLLTHADELYARFPPTHPAIGLPTVMGPQSVMRTWSEHAADLPDDDEAERMVMRPELIVLPYVEEERDDSDEHEQDGRQRKEKEERERRRRRLRKPRRLTDMVVQRKTMVAGAVLVLGVAMAVYGLNGGLPGGGGGRHHRSGLGKELKKFGKLLGGAITGARGKVFDGIRRGLE